MKITKKVQLGAIGKNAQDDVKRRNMGKPQEGAIGYNWENAQNETSKYVKITKKVQLGAIGCNWVQLGKMLRMT